MKQFIVNLIILFVLTSQLAFAQQLDFDYDESEFKSEFKERISFGDEKYEGRYRYEEKYEFRERGAFEPDFGPEYENKEQMLFGRLFGLIEEDINEFELMGHCNEPEKIADIVINKVKGKIGDIPNVCKEIEEHEIECKQRVEEDCSYIGQPDLRFARDEREKMEMEAYACPPNKDLIKEFCILDSRVWVEDRLNYLEEDCIFEWERYGARDSECKIIGEECSKGKFIERCMEGFGDFEEECPYIEAPECRDGYLEEEFDNNGCLVDYYCVPFDKGCPKVYEPVCGDDGVTYYNDCEAEEIGVGYTYGECQQCPISEEAALRMENDCIAGNGSPEKIWDKDCVVDVVCHKEQENLITGSIVGISGGITYEEAKEQCSRDWESQQDYCIDLKQRCDKGIYVNECIAREKENIEFDLENTKRQCERDARLQVRHMERECSRINFEKERCFEEGNSQCERMEGLATECRDRMTEENFRNFIITEAEKHCRFVPFIKKKEDFEKYEKMDVVFAVFDTISEEDMGELRQIVESLSRKFELDGKIIFEGIISPSRFGELKRLNYVINAKLNAPKSSERAKSRKEEIISINPEKIVEKLLEVRNTKLPSEYRYLVEDKASEILEVSDDLEEVAEREGEKGFAYKIRLFLGFAKDIEEGEIQRLGQSKARLETSIKTLGRLAEEAPDTIAKAILKEQVDELVRQKDDLDSLIEQKQKKAKGLLRLFGLFS